MKTRKFEESQRKMALLMSNFLIPIGKDSKPKRGAKTSFTGLPLARVESFDQAATSSKKPLVSMVDKWIAQIERDNFKLAKTDECLIDRVQHAQEEKQEIFSKEKSVMDYYRSLDKNIQKQKRLAT